MLKKAQTGLLGRAVGTGGGGRQARGRSFQPIMADQLTLFYPWGKDYAQLITTRPRRHGFSDLPTDLLAITSVGFGAVLAFLVCIPPPPHTHT